MEEFREGAAVMACDLTELEVNWGGDWVSIPCRASIRQAEVAVAKDPAGPELTKLLPRPRKSHVPSGKRPDRR